MKKASYVNLSRQESGALLARAVGTAVEILRCAQDDTKKRFDSTRKKTRRSHASIEDSGFFASLWNDTRHTKKNGILRFVLE